MSKISWDDKVPAVGNDPAAWTPEMKVSASDMNAVKGSVNALYDSGGGGYRCFSGYISFSGSTPSMIVDFNSLGGELEISNPSNGRIRITSEDLFTTNKTRVFLGNGVRNCTIVTDFLSASYLNIDIYDAENTQTNTPAFKMAIEIRVYS